MNLAKVVLVSSCLLLSSAVFSGCGEKEDSDCVRYAKLARDGAKSRADNEWSTAQEIISSISDGDLRRQQRQLASDSRTRKYEVAESAYRSAISKCSDANTDS